MWIRVYSLPDILEVKLPVITKDKPRERNKEFRKRRVHIHKILRLDIPRRKLPKVDFIKTR